MRLPSAFILFLMMSSPPVFAGFYKWVDASGNVSYGERPGNSEAEKITIRTNETTKPRIPKTAGEDSAEQNSGDGTSGQPDESSAGEQQASAEPPTERFVEEKIPAREKRQLCNQAKQDIASISSRGRMREINKKGEYYFLSEKERQHRLSAAKKRKRQYCN